MQSIPITNFPADLGLLAQFAAVIALVVTASILSSGCLTLVHTIQNCLINTDIDGDIATYNSDAIDLRKRMLRFPRKAYNFYICSVGAVVVAAISTAVKGLLVFRGGPRDIYIANILENTIANASVLPMFLTTLAAYAIFLGHSIYSYKKIYSDIVFLGES